MKEQIFEVFLKTVIPIVATLLMSAFAWAAKQLAAKWGAEAKNSKMSAIGNKLVTFANTAVHEVEATLRAKYLEAAADGKITAEEAAEMKRTAVDAVLKSLGTHGVEEVKGILGVGAEALPGFLNGLVEKAVAGLPSSTEVAGPVAVAVAAPGVAASAPFALPGGLPPPQRP